MTVFRWLGQACFLITTLMGTRILIDPPHPQVGYHITAHSIPANLVFVSHEHMDHNFTAAAAPMNGEQPKIVQPLPLAKVSPDGTVTTQIQSGIYHRGPVGGTVDRVRFRRISAFHDNEGGKLRGPDTITVLTTENGLRIVHMGDIGQLALDADQLAAIGHVDVLMIPVGGFYTVDGPQAAAIVAELHPRVIIPMHDRTQALNSELRGKLAAPGAFLTAMKGKAKVVYMRTRDLQLSPATLPQMPTVYILRYQ